MKVLLLGGTRYFGKLLTQRLIDAGCDVTIFSTGSSKFEVSGKYKHVYGDRRDQSSLARALGNTEWDVVYDQICFSEAEALVTTKLFKDRIGKLIFTSSQSIYEYGVKLSENAFNAVDFVTKASVGNDYQTGKRLAEKVYATHADFPVISVRIPIVLAPEDPTRRLHWHVARIKFGEPIFFPNIDAKISVISASDAARFLEWVKETSHCGAINACSDGPLYLKKLVLAIEAITGEKLVCGSSDAALLHSPFGVEHDWTMATDLAQQLGYKFEPMENWMPSLVAQLRSSVVAKDTRLPPR